ncbi:hypothetical protein [Nitratidesulfovibrio sp. 1201_IL3209]|uniref:hypothetical protein n=1 Tax=Nitratidesulfovibrio sp. 1201_IL3209 TaxID=3084053 RepID=UPI002FDB6C15
MMNGEGEHDPTVTEVRNDLHTAMHDLRVPLEALLEVLDKDRYLNLRLVLHALLRDMEAMTEDLSGALCGAGVDVTVVQSTRDGRVRRIEVAAHGVAAACRVAHDAAPADIQ